MNQFATDRLQRIAFLTRQRRRKALSLVGSGEPLAEDLALFSSTSSPNSTIAKPAGLTVGMTLIAFVGVGSTAGTLSIPTGWSAATDFIVYDRANGRVFWRVVDGTEGASFTFGGAVDNGTGVALVALKGANTTNPFRTLVFKGVASNTTLHDLAQVTFPAPPNTLRLAFAIGGWAGGFTYTPPASMVELLEFETTNTANNGCTMSLASQANPGEGITPANSRFVCSVGLHYVTFHADIQPAA